MTVLNLYNLLLFRSLLHFKVLSLASVPFIGRAFGSRWFGAREWTSVSNVSTPKLKTGMKKLGRNSNEYYG